MEGDSPMLQFIGRWCSEIYQEREMVLMYLHLLFSALFPIYIGSHASLRCPPSAEDSTKKKSVAARLAHDDDEDDLDDLEQSALEGMTPSDAILFPVFASITLGGLYFLIKWLNDPALLNRILGYYFSLIGVFGVGKLAGDAMNVLTTVAFPSVWSRGTEVYYIDPLLSQQFINAPTTRGMNRAPLHRKFTNKTSPLPGVISMLKFPESINKLLWNFRALVTSHWVFRCYVHGITNIKTRVRLNDVMGLILGIFAIVMYNSNKLWWLTNLMGFGFCYGTLQIMSPTTFWTGSLVLGGLFIYDIVMVFYTYVSFEIFILLGMLLKEFVGHSW
jgi:minor histocompatibility antigen H13